MAQKDKGQAPTAEEQGDQQQQKSDCFSEGKAQGGYQAKEGAAQERTKELEEGPAYTPEQEQSERQQAAQKTEAKDDGDKQLQREGAQERTQELEKGPAYTPEQEENERQQAVQGKPANEGLAPEGQAAEGQGAEAPEPLMAAIGAAVVQATREAWDPADGQPERELN